MCRYFVLTLFVLWSSVTAAEVIDIGSRLELFTDDFLVEEMSDGVTHHLHQPEPGEVVLVTDQPWEGNTCAYYTIFQDGDLYRMYYRGSHADEKTKKFTHPEVTCYAESKDGIHWTKPELGIVEFEGSAANNIILDGIGSHCFVAFKDENPNCPDNARYKGISRGRPHGKKGLYVYQSADAIHWSLIKDEPVITQGAFDSQNLAFWDPLTGKYHDYHRTFTNGVRSILTCESDDYVNWSKPVPLVYPNAPNQHLYTNAVRPYFRAPHIRIGFPTRFLPKSQQVEPVFMSSRDGVNFHRFSEPVIPQSAPEDRDGNRSNYMANALVTLPDHPDELTVYATEAYYSGPDSRLRRFTYRQDGFVSLRAAEQSATVVTKPFTFRGNRLILNFRTKSNGHVRAELQNEQGRPIPGFEMQNSEPLIGDHIQGHVQWSSADRNSLSSLAGKPVKLKLELKNTDLYSYQFQDSE